MTVFGLSRFVDLRAGERRLFLRAFSVLLLTICGHTLLETARDALFLTKLAPRMLAPVYVTTALALVILTPISVRLTRKAGPKNALTLSLLLTAFGAAWFRVQPTTAATVFGLYVFGALSATLVIGLFWLVASGLFSAAQGRRLFGPLASGGVLGAIGGAGVASLLLEIAPLRSLLALASLAYFGAALVATKIPSEDVSPPAAGTATTTSTTAGGSRFERLRRDPFVARLAVIAALSIIVSVFVDYLYKVKVSSSLASSDLGPFFARYQLVLNAASLLLQVVLIGPIVQRIGVVGLALTGPLTLTLGGTLTALLSAPLWPVVILKGADTALRNSIGRVASELLWAPVEQQAQARGLVDLIVTRGTQALAGVGLLALTLSYDLSPRLLASVAALVALLWLLAQFGIRHAYIALFRSALSRGSVERDFSLTELDLTSVEALVEALARPQASEVIAAINVLAARKRDRLIPALILLHPDERVLERALELLGPSRRQDWYALGERLLDHTSSHLQLATVRAFALAGASGVLRRIQDHPNPNVRTFVALYLAQLEGKTIEGDPLTWELFANDDENHTLKRAFIEALAAHPTKDAPRILLDFACLLALQSSVTLALETVGDASSIGFLVSRLKWADERLSARRGLQRLGKPALLALESALWDEALDRRVRIHVPRSIALFAPAEAAPILLHTLATHKDGLVRYKALLGLEQLALESSVRIDAGPIFQELRRNGMEYLRLFSAKVALEHDSQTPLQLERVLVTELLDDKIRQSWDRLARLLQVLHRSDDIPAIFSALLSSDRRQRGRAVEFLDALIRGFHRSSDEVAQLLRLVVDDLPAKERAHRARDLVGVFSDARAALAALARDADAVVQELSVRALETLDSLRLRQALPVVLEEPA